MKVTGLGMASFAEGYEGQRRYEQEEKRRMRAEKRAQADEAFREKERGYKEALFEEALSPEAVSLRKEERGLGIATAKHKLREQKRQEETDVLTDVYGMLEADPHTALTFLGQLDSASDDNPATSVRYGLTEDGKVQPVFTMSDDDVRQGGIVPLAEFKEALGDRLRLRGVEMRQPEKPKPREMDLGDRVVRGYDDPETGEFVQTKTYKKGAAPKAQGAPTPKVLGKEHIYVKDGVPGVWVQEGGEARFVALGDKGSQIAPAFGEEGKDRSVQAKRALDSLLKQYASKQETIDIQAGKITRGEASAWKVMGELANDPNNPNREADARNFAKAQQLMTIIEDSAGLDVAPLEGNNEPPHPDAEWNEDLGAWVRRGPDGKLYKAVPRKPAGS